MQEPTRIKNNKTNRYEKYVKIALLVIVALIFIGTFVFLYQKSQPKASVYTILNAEITDLKKTTVATGK